MDSATRPANTIEPPTRADGARAAGDAERLFRRQLGGWATDVLVLRQRGLVHPTWHAGPGQGEARSVAA